METRPIEVQKQAKKVSLVAPLAAAFVAAVVARRPQASRTIKSRRELGMWVPRFLRSKYAPRNGRFYQIRTAETTTEAGRLAAGVPRGASERTKRKAWRLAAERQRVLMAEG